MTKTPQGLLTTADLETYRQDGFAFARKAFSSEEIELLSRAAREDKALDEAASAMDDGAGNPVRLSLWNHPGDGLYGMFARCRRVVDTIEDILDDEAYHYHSKMILKDARTGGAWAWHQDYGYWYQNGILWPNMCSAYIAVDRATEANGCLQVLRASHHLGRVDHILSGDQAGANMERVEEARKRLETVPCVMEPGDVLFFHCNLLHASAANNSDHPRWAMICCYNARSNDPYKESHHPRYTKLHRVDDSEVLRVGRKRFEEGGDDGPAFVDLKGDDKSARSLAQAS